MKKIIVTDDNRTFLMYLGLILRRFDFKVMPAENGIELLKLLKLVGSDLVLLDVHMTNMDGITVLRHIKSDKALHHIPVIMLSTDASTETREQCSSLGCYDFITKPVKIAALHDSLQRCFFSHKGTNRKCLRIPFRKKVIVSYNGTPYELFAETLSEGGMYIRKEDPIPVGSEVTIQCSLHDGCSLHTSGKVIYTKKLYGDFLILPPGMAVEFTGLQESAVAPLRDYIKDSIAKDILDSRSQPLFET